MANAIPVHRGTKEEQPAEPVSSLVDLLAAPVDLDNPKDGDRHPELGTFVEQNRCWVKNVR
jgi:hypothetical protein